MYVVVMDGSYLLHRVRFAAQSKDWKMFTFMFLRSMIKGIEEADETVDKVYVLWDKDGSAYREKLFPDYKISRKNRINDESIVAFYDSFAYLHKVLPTLGIISVVFAGIEADDFAFHLGRVNEKGVFISDDKDWFILMKEGFKLVRPLAEEYYDWKRMVETFGDNPTEWNRVYKALFGDASDDVPGFKGVGKGRAKTFADTIMSGSRQLGTTKAALAVMDNWKQYELNYKLVGFDHVVEQEKMFKSIVKAAEFDSKNFKPSQEKWFKIAADINSETLPQWYFRLIENLK